MRPRIDKDLLLNPRKGFEQAIRDKDAIGCLVKTAAIHGHFCPGIALGVMASIYGLGCLGGGLTSSAWREDLVAVVETNACFSDGGLVVSGCTLGNNALVYRDIGRTAVTFSERNMETGIRVRVKPDFRSKVDMAVPEFFPMLDKLIRKREGNREDMASFMDRGREAAFALVQLPFEDVLAAKEVRVDLPDYAPIVDSAVCAGCGEEIMGTKTVAREEGGDLCRICAGRGCHQVEGQGIVLKD